MKNVFADNDIWFLPICLINLFGVESCSVLLSNSFRKTKPSQTLTRAKYIFSVYKTNNSSYLYVKAHSG